LLLRLFLSGADAVVASAGDPSSVIIAATATAEAAASASASASSAFGHGSLEAAFSFSKKTSLPLLSGLDDPGAPSPDETVWLTGGSTVGEVTAPEHCCCSLLS
jgi:hypothetical protein